MIDTLGLYKVLDRLGSSRLGDVYRARDTKHGRTVAMTVVGEAIGHDPERRACLVRDAHAVQACTHPSVSCLFDVGEEDGRLYLVFEFAPGDPLEALMARGPLNPRRAIEIAVQVADGLADSHAVGLVHADLRPGTIVMTPKGNAKIYNIIKKICHYRSVPSQRMLGSAIRAAAFTTPRAAAAPVNVGRKF